MWTTDLRKLIYRHSTGPSDFQAALVPEPFWIISFTGPTEVMASKRSPMVLERSIWAAEEPRYRPAKSATGVGRGNGSTGSSWAGVLEPRLIGRGSPDEVVTSRPTWSRHHIFGGTSGEDFKLCSCHFVQIKGDVGPPVWTYS